MIYDLNKFPCNRKPYADSTLRAMKKSELIDIIREYEHNYSALYKMYERGSSAAEKMLRDAGIIGTTP